MPAYFNSPSSRPTALTNYTNSPTSPAAVVTNYQNSPFGLPPASPYLWYDAQDINLGGNAGILDTDPIGTWKNKGSAGVAGDLTQAVGANKPLFKKLGLAGKLNNLSTVTFGAKWVTVAAGLSVNQPDLVAIVLKTTNLNSIVVYQMTAGGAQQLAINPVGGFWELYAGTVQNTSIAATINNYHLLLTTWNAASTGFRADLATGTVPGTVGTQNGTGFTLGSDPGGLNPMAGEIAECIVWNTVPANADVEGYFNAKYGSTWPQ